MKTFKQLDFYGQIVLIIVLTLLSIINQDYTFIYAYIIVGAWQVISMILHMCKNWFYHGGRRLYTVITAIIIFCMLLGYISEIFMLIFFPMLFLAPAFALIYLFICYDELFNKLTQRPLHQLK